MAAKNNDSQKIFEAYASRNGTINEVAPIVAGGAALAARALPYAARALPAVGRGVAAAGRGIANAGKGAVQAAKNFGKGVSNPRMTNLPSGQNAATKAGSWVARHPGTVAATGVAGGMELQKAIGGNSNADPAAAAPESASEPAAAADSNSQSDQSSLSLNSTPDTSLETVKPGEAVAAGTGASTGLGQAVKTSGEQGGGTSETSTQVAKGEPSSEEKELFKKLHGSDYTPGVGDQRLAELRQAVQQTGSTDVSKVAPAAYAQQYAGTPQGQAYAKRAEAIGIKVPKPGEVSQTPTNYAQQFVSPENQQAMAALQPKQNQTNYAQQAADLGLSPETQQDLGGQGSAPASSSTAQPNMNAQQFIELGKKLGLSQNTLSEIEKQFQKS